MVKIDCDDRFWSKVDTTDKCWEWLGAKDGGGYGRFLHNGRNRHAHRIAWLLFHGREPNGVVMHTCDNPSCVKPKHLRIGTQRENIHDCVAKDRNFKPRGSLNSQAKLTEEQVAAIRKEYNQTNCTKRFLACKYNMSDSAIGRLLNGQTWQ